MRDLRTVLRPIADRRGDLDAVIERVGEARVVALGEATHGTHEMYAVRRELTRRLVEEKGFSTIIVEADWPDAYRVNRYVRGGSDDHTAEESLLDFVRFPRWMWRNTDVVELVTWLRDENRGRPPERRIGFYGMDLYSLFGSMAAVVRYLEDVDPEAARRARDRYGCFDRFDGDPQLYGRVAGIGLGPDCEDAAVDQLLDMLQQAEVHVRGTGLAALDDELVAQQNARVVKKAEQYYRAMFGGRADTWNLRDNHMTETIEHVRDHLRATGRSDRVVIWAHNTHVGDARATDMGEHGQLSVGQLLRERHGEDVVLVGFTTHRGSVTAASRWDGPAEKMRVRAALDGSWEDLFHELGEPRFTLSTHDAPDALTGWKLERAIGVVYLPRSERESHYFRADIGRQFDVLVHLGETSAVTPLERWSKIEADRGVTYPFGG